MKKLFEKYREGYKLIKKSSKILLPKKASIIIALKLISIIIILGIFFTIIYANLFSFISIIRFEAIILMVLLVFIIVICLAFINNLYIYLIKEYLDKNIDNDIFEQEFNDTLLKYSKKRDKNSKIEYYDLKQLSDYINNYNYKITIIPQIFNLNLIIYLIIIFIFIIIMRNLF